MSGDAVTTHALTKRYADETALENVSLSVPEGAVYVLAGANGAGKSTTLRVLMNLEHPDSGRAAVFGLDTVRHGPRVRAQIGYVPELPVRGDGWMTCGGLLRHAAAYYPAWDAPYVEHLCRAFDLKTNRVVGRLSKGETRRLQLVLALAHRPPLLLLDEPTDGLDPVMRERTLALLAEHLADSPATVVIATHQIHEVASLADHVGALRGGRLITQLARHDLLRTVRRYRIEAAEGWQPPAALRFAGLQRTSTGREVEGMVVGEEREVTERLAAAGARVRDVTPLPLEDAMIALLRSEDAP